MNATRKDDEIVIIKKYANRRLYNTDTSVYVTLDDLYDMVKQGQDFEVRDAKTSEDLTRSVLTQIIFDRESRGMNNLLPMNFLKTIISFYDDQKLKPYLPAYLEASLNMFVKNQERWMEMIQQSSPFSPPSMPSFNDAMQHFNPVENLEEMTKRNLELFEQTMNMFNPFGTVSGDSDKKK